MIQGCPICGDITTDNAPCQMCQESLSKVVSVETKRRRKVVDMINKDKAVAKKVAEFLNVK